VAGAFQILEDHFFRFLVEQVDQVISYANYLFFGMSRGEYFYLRFVGSSDIAAMRAMVIVGNKLCRCIRTCFQRLELRVRR